MVGSIHMSPIDAAAIGGKLELRFVVPLHVCCYDDGRKLEIQPSHGVLGLSQARRIEASGRLEFSG
jgi:hypothetical protein